MAPVGQAPAGVRALRPQVRRLRAGDHPPLEGDNPSLRVTILDGPQTGRLEAADGHIPHRNLLLIGTAVAALQTRVVYLGVLRGETSRDKSRRFLRQTRKVLSFCEGPVRAFSPSKRLTKTQLAALLVTSFIPRGHITTQYLHPYPSYANLILSQGVRYDACVAKEALATRGILTRYYSFPPVTSAPASASRRRQSG